jgi:hypothetical protein
MRWRNRSWGRDIMKSGPMLWGSGMPLNSEQAKGALERHYVSSGIIAVIPRIIAETDRYFELEIIDKNGSLVCKHVIDKQTGWIQSVDSIKVGPNQGSSASFPMS